MKAKVLKSLLLAAMAILLVVATVLATMAYLTSSSAVSNVFTVGNITIDMKETKVNNAGEPVNAAGVKVDNIADAAKTDTNSYHLLPGSSYLKDPTITVSADCDPSYLFVRVRNDLKTIEKGYAGHVDGALTIVEQLRANGWHEIERAENGVDAVFVYVGKDETVTGAEGLASMTAMPVGGTKTAETYKVFENFTLANTIPNLSTFGGARVAVVAYAIQTKLDNVTAPVGTPDAYKAAWAYVKAELPFVV